MTEESNGGDDRDADSVARATAKDSTDDDAEQAVVKLGLEALVDGSFPRRRRVHTLPTTNEHATH